MHFRNAVMSQSYGSIVRATDEAFEAPQATLFSVWERDFLFYCADLLHTHKVNLDDTAEERGKWKKHNVSP